MCKNAVSTASSLMLAIEPTLVDLLTVTGIANTPDGEAAIKAFDAAQSSLSDWTPGTPATTVIEALDAFTAVFAVLPLPTEYKALEGIISAGIVTVIGVVTANSPAPTSDTSQKTASEEESQGAHIAHVASETAKKVTELVPGFKRSIFTSPAHQYKNEWNKAVENMGPAAAGLKQSA